MHAKGAEIKKILIRKNTIDSGAEQSQDTQKFLIVCMYQHV